MKEIARREQYERFKWKRMHVANITKVLNERECASRTLHRFYMKENARREHYASMKLYIRDCTSFWYLTCIRQVNSGI